MGALGDLDAQGVGQLAADADGLHIGQLVGDGGGGLVLVQQEQVPALADAAGLEHLLLGIAGGAGDENLVRLEKQGQGRHNGAAYHHEGEQSIKKRKVALPFPAAASVSAGLGHRKRLPLCSLCVCGPPEGPGPRAGRCSPGGCGGGAPPW